MKHIAILAVLAIAAPFSRALAGEGIGVRDGEVRAVSVQPGAAQLILPLPERQTCHA